ncbi:aspartate/glutamate racemase family protein [Sulfitobacter aestuariivivens]|uniref:Aspartate/glutamate racemase family protein n=1 Tax=Sulfitobacter aestuariivivens TaxID=2766981 RepID=A0A927D4D8_9RHOB|nr:aspartate/glutamate racemase family protein [Sulfitobacter aestuariivivens]MBD3664923.1 aspartate/glutamate racemase family protein [Sulfitobacter aestuariivivens]
MNIQSSSSERARLGILMLDSTFPRILGDVGNADTWPFPVRYAIVPGATPHAVVCEDSEPFVQAFIEAGRGLVAEGCTGIATTCGFLAPLRSRLASALGVPVAASSLEQAPQIAACLPADKRVGILTISASTLSSALLQSAGVPPKTPVQGVDGGSFAKCILGNETRLDVAAARAEMEAGAKALVSAHPNVGAILLECTNMVPYAQDIHTATGLPVHSIYGYLRWFHQSLAPSHFDN